MSQPRYDSQQLAQYSNTELASELRAWAAAREDVNHGRIAQGKEPLDSSLLREAANRLEGGRAPEGRPYD